MNTGGFSCPWDSGCVGAAYIDKKEFIKEFGKKKWTKKLQEKAIWWIQTDVETYDNYISGQVYRYSIENSEEEQEEDFECGIWITC